MKEGEEATALFDSIFLQFLDPRIVVERLRILEGVLVQNRLPLDDLLYRKLDLLHCQGVGNVRDGNDLGGHMAGRGVDPDGLPDLLLKFVGQLPSLAPS